MTAALTLLSVRCCVLHINCCLYDGFGYNQSIIRMNIQTVLWGRLLAHFSEVAAAEAAKNKTAYNNAKAQL